MVIVDNCGLSNRRLTLTGCTKESDCERTYLLYLPNSLCVAIDEDDEGQSPVMTNKDGETRRRRQQQQRLESHSIIQNIPLVIGLHGFTGSNQIFLPWTDVAEKYTYVLAIPDGLEKSWNGKFCCGYALEQEIDDVGFLQSLIVSLSEEFSFLQPNLVYGVGHSNGGFMVTYAARLFRAIAPVSGYQYVHELSELTYIAPTSTSIFMHHSKDDRVVKFMGCCNDPAMPKCCCGISDFMNHCTPAYEAFHNWASHVNGCRTGTTGSTFLDEQHYNYSDSSTSMAVVVTNVSYSNDEVGVVCHTGTDCQANSTICIYEKSGHFKNFQVNFPMKDEISEFFMKDACTLVHGGVWNQKNGTCGSGSAFLATNSKQSDTELTDRVLEGRRWTIAVITLVMIVLLGFFLWRRRRQEKKLRGWKQVPTSELELIS